MIERAALHQHRRHRATIAIHLGFDHDAAGELVRVRLQFVHVSDQQDDLEQIIQAQLLTRGHLDEGNVAAPILRARLPSRRAAA